MRRKEKQDFLNCWLICTANWISSLKSCTSVFKSSRLKLFQSVLVVQNQLLYWRQKQEATLQNAFKSHKKRRRKYKKVTVSLAKKKKAFCGGKDVLVLLSTGFGKSFAKHMKWLDDTPRHATNKKPQDVANRLKRQ